MNEIYSTLWVLIKPKWENMSQLRFELSQGGQQFLLLTPKLGPFNAINEVYPRKKSQTFISVRRKFAFIMQIENTNVHLQTKKSEIS